MLNSVAQFGSSGGLGEAAAWLCLRQDIYVSLVSQQPLKTHLENYHTSKTFQNDDDLSLANRMVFLLAKLVSWVFDPDKHADVENLQLIKTEIEEWNNNKGPAFEPILFNQRSSAQGRAWPEIWMLFPPHGTFFAHHCTHSR